MRPEWSEQQSVHGILKLSGDTMPVIHIDEKEILVTVGPKIVNPNGQIAIGRKYAGRRVKVYVIEVEVI